MAEGNRPGESSEGGNPQQGNSPASEAMQRVADALQQAAQQLGLPSPAPTSSDSAQQTASGSSQSSEGGTDGSGARTSLRLVDLEAELGQLNSRNWGELPGKLRTELLQSTERRPADDYAPLIREYFEEIRRRRSADEALPQP